MVRRFLSYEIVGARRFYERKEIKDLIAYLRLIVNGEIAQFSPHYYSQKV